jgi:ATP-dependent Clp protease protease subunit
MNTELKRVNKFVDHENEEPSRTIILSADVDQDSFYDIISRILYINDYDDESEETVKDYVRRPIKMIINSYGGTIYDGFGIIGVMENSKTPIHTYCYGSAMSMALLIFVSGHYRYANRLCTFMYHECLDQPIYEKLTTLAENMEESKRIMEMYDKQLLTKSTLRRKQLDDSKKNKIDWYMTPEMGQKYGFVDEII